LVKMPKTRFYDSEILERIRIVGIAFDDLTIDTSGFI
jgi:hypothetical protein